MKTTNYLVLSTCLVGLAMLSKQFSGIGERFVRGNLGDVLIVIAAYLALRVVWTSASAITVMASVLALAVGVELLQAAGLFTSQMNWVAAYWLGNRYDPLDLVAYSLGAVLGLLLEHQLLTLLARSLRE